MKITKRMLSVLLALMMTMIFSLQVFASASLPSISSSKPIICYTLSASGKLYAYTDANLKTKTGGYISCASDECKIIQISGDAVRVTYPTGKGTKTAWFPRNAFTAYNIAGDASESWTQANKITTYKRSGGVALGSISAGDNCYKLTTNDNYTQVIYPVSGGYKMGWVKSSEIKSKTDPLPIINLPTNIEYAPYNGVSYQNLSAKRVKALDKAKQMVTIRWTAPITFPTWQSAKGGYNIAKAEDGTSSSSFVKGKTYTGIPYSMADRTFDDIAWKNALNNGKITTSYMTAKYGGRSATTGHGVDCSYFVYLAYNAAGCSVGDLDTASMLKSSKYEKISLGNMQGGDIFLKNGHVMMYIGKSGNNYAVFEADADDSKCSYNVYSANYLSAEGYGCYRLKELGSTPNPAPVTVLTPIPTPNTKNTVALENLLFDADVYFNNYTDLQNAFGYNTNSLKNHYKTFGISEGRIASVFFDPVYYLNNNADVAKAYGKTNYKEAYNHFVNYGFWEGRAGSKYFSSRYYLDKHSDIKKAYDNDYLAAAQHFYSYGINEQRQASSEFSIAAYIQYNDDVKKAFSNGKDYIKHYIRYVRLGTENRRCV